MENKCEKCGVLTKYGETYSFRYGSSGQSTSYAGSTQITATAWTIYPEPMHVYLCNRCVAINDLSLKPQDEKAAFFALILGIATVCAGVLTVNDAVEGKSGLLCVSGIVIAMAIATGYLWSIARKKNARYQAELAKDIADIEQAPIESIKPPVTTLEAKKLRLKWVTSFRTNELKQAGATHTWSPDDPSLHELLAKLALSKYYKQ